MDFRKKTIRDIDWQGKIALVRVDYNVPVKNGEVVDDMRIRASLPTIKYLFANGVKKIVLMSHMGRPEGQRNAELSLLQVTKSLSRMLSGRSIGFINEAFGEMVANAIAKTPDGGILLLENLRFWPEEEANSLEFMQAIVNATGADYFVQDGFAVIHRAHASTEAITHILPAVAGLLVEDEVTKLQDAMQNPEHPVLVMIGGAKVADKQPLIDRFLPLADWIAVGGKIAADGYRSDNPKIYVAQGFRQDEAGAKLDIDEMSIKQMLMLVEQAKTIIWNGAMGKTEDAQFAQASAEIAKAMGSRQDATTIVGGGDTTSFVQDEMKKNPDLHFSLVSTGGGASLEFLSGKTLPGLEALRDR